MKRTVRDNIHTAYSLHDMNVIAFEVSGNDVTMRTQSGMVKTIPPYKQVDGFVEFHDLDWDFCFVYLMGGYGNIGKFTGEKLYFKDFIYVPIGRKVTGNFLVFIMTNEIVKCNKRIICLAPCILRTCEI